MNVLLVGPSFFVALDEVSTPEQISGGKVFFHNKNGFPMPVTTFTFCSSECVKLSFIRSTLSFPFAWVLGYVQLEKVLLAETWG